VIDEAWARAHAESWVSAWNAHDLDAIVALYADEVEFRSPFVVTRRVDPQGRLPPLRTLPATAANLRLTDIRAAHPTAKVYPPPSFALAAPLVQGLGNRDAMTSQGGPRAMHGPPDLSP
jgi:hypothetical protein